MNKYEHYSPTSIKIQGRTSSKTSRKNLTACLTTIVIDIESLSTNLQKILKKHNLAIKEAIKIFKTFKKTSKVSLFNLLFKNKQRRYIKPQLASIQTFFNSQSQEINRKNSTNFSKLSSFDPNSGFPALMRELKLESYFDDKSFELICKDYLKNGLIDMKNLQESRIIESFYADSKKIERIKMKGNISSSVFDEAFDKMTNENIKSFFLDSILENNTKEILKNFSEMFECEIKTMAGIKGVKALSMFIFGSKNQQILRAIMHRFRKWIRVTAKSEYCTNQLWISVRMRLDIENKEFVEKFVNLQTLLKINSYCSQINKFLTLNHLKSIFTLFEALVLFQFLADSELELFKLIDKYSSKTKLPDLKNYTNLGLGYIFFGLFFSKSQTVSILN